MEMLPDKPTGSIIEEDVDSEGITLRWWPPAAGFIHYATAAPYALFFCVWLVACFEVGKAILIQPVGFTIVGLCFLAWVGACLGYAVWVLGLAPDRPASVRLEAEWLRYDPGRSKVSARQQLFEKRSPKGEPPPTPRPLAVRRSEIRGLALDGDGGGLWLSVDSGSKRVEIGAGLPEPEREWLHAVLQRWLAPNKPLQPTAAP